MSQTASDEFVASKGIPEACEDHASKEIIAEQFPTATVDQELTKSEMVVGEGTAVSLPRTPLILSDARFLLAMAESPLRFFGSPHSTL